MAHGCLRKYSVIGETIGATLKASNRHLQGASTTKVGADKSSNADSEEQQRTILSYQIFTNSSDRS